MNTGFASEVAGGACNSSALVAPVQPAGVSWAVPCTMGTVRLAPPRSGNSPQSIVARAFAETAPLQPVKAYVIHSTPSSLRGAPEGSGSSSVTR